MDEALRPGLWRPLSATSADAAVAALNTPIYAPLQIPWRASQMGTFFARRVIGPNPGHVNGGMCMTTRFARYVMVALLSGPLVGYAADSQLKEESKQFSDAAVTARVKAELARSQDLNVSNIQVSSTKGAVILGGTAKTQDEAERAAALVKGVKGVVTVQNDIKVGDFSGVGSTR